MDEARNWIIGLAVLAVLAVGTVVVLRPAGSLDGLGDDEIAATAPTGTNTWGEATPNFVAGEATDEHQGGSGNSVGWGKLSVNDVCLQEGIDLELAESRLDEYGLLLESGNRIRELADASGYKPSEVVGILLGEVPGEGDCDGDCGGECEDGDDHDEDDTSESDL